MFPVLTDLAANFLLQETLQFVFKLLRFYFILYFISFYTCTIYFQVFTTSSLNLQGRSALDATELAYARQVGLTVNKHLKIN